MTGSEDNTGAQALRNGKVSAAILFIARELNAHPGQDLVVPAGLARQMAETLATAAAQVVLMEQRLPPNGGAIVTKNSAELARRFGENVVPFGAKQQTA